MGTYTDAFELQLNLLDMAKADMNVYGKYGITEDPGGAWGGIPAQRGAWGKDYEVNVRKSVSIIAEAASTYYVAPDIVRMVTAALPSLPDTTGLRVEDLPSPWGFVYLDPSVPLDYLTPGGYQHHVRGFCWGVTEDMNRISIFTFGTSTQPAYPEFRWRDQRTGRMVGDFSYVDVIDASNWLPGDTIGNHSGSAAALEEFLKEWGDKPEYPYTYIDAQKPHYREIMVSTDVHIEMISKHKYLCRQLALGFLHFMTQRIVVLNPRPLDRAARRRLATARSPLPVFQVELLRRKEYRPSEYETERAPVDWSCRWVVSGHWRNQWYASEERHKPLWIEPYVKGPADKPVKAPTKIFAVTR